MTSKLENDKSMIRKSTEYTEIILKIFLVSSFFLLTLLVGFFPQYRTYGSIALLFNIFMIIWLFPIWKVKHLKDVNEKPINVIDAENKVRMTHIGFFSTIVMPFLYFIYKINIEKKEPFDPSQPTDTVEPDMSTNPFLYEGTSAECLDAPEDHEPTDKISLTRTDIK